MRERPVDIPPLRHEVPRYPWQRCFWRAHVYRWLRANPTYLQEVCIYCGSTALTSFTPEPDSPKAA